VGADAIKKRVRRSIEALITSEPFTTWLTSEKGFAADDLIAFNNSFVFRDTVRTKKHTEYLALVRSASGKLPMSSLLVVSPPSFNVDFKHFSRKSSNVGRRTVDEAIREQLARCGELVFVLVGRIDDTVGLEMEFPEKPFRALRFDPTAKGLLVRR